MTVASIEAAYRSGNFCQLARDLPHCAQNTVLTQNLLSSNLLTMGKHLNGPAITFGADPEFILTDEDGKIVLFSSNYTNNRFGLSELEIGADYGLLELRIEPAHTVEGFLENIDNTRNLFIEGYPELSLLEAEAVEFDHRRQKILETLEKDIGYGNWRGKDVGVWNDTQDNIQGIETGKSLSAYDKPVFNTFDPKLLTAGGHIHIGGAYVLMLSLEQLKSLVIKIEERVLPISLSTESPAGELRRSVYGSKGEFRIKEYGIEYRTLSNSLFWPQNREKLKEVMNIIEETVCSFLLLAGVSR